MQGPGGIRERDTRAVAQAHPREALEGALTQPHAVDPPPHHAAAPRRRRLPPVEASAGRPSRWRRPGSPSGPRGQRWRPAETGLITGEQCRYWDMNHFIICRLVGEVGEIQESIGLLNDKMREAQTVHQAS